MSAETQGYMPDDELYKPKAEVIVNEIVEKSLGPISEMRSQIDRGDYKIIIGDDSSGRIPALVWRDFLRRVNMEKGENTPETYFLAGSRGLHGKERQDKIHKIQSFLSELKPEEKLNSKQDKVLIITDTIETGESLVPLTQALMTQGINYEIVTNVYLGDSPLPVMEANLGCKIHVGPESNGYAPYVYAEAAASGVVKDTIDLHASPINTREAFNQPSHELLSMTRELIPSAGEKLFEYYRNNES